MHFSEPFVVTVDSSAGMHGDTQSDAQALSIDDVLASGEHDLFAQDHAHDNAQLNVHDVEGGVSSMDSLVVNGASATTHDLSSLTTNLVLPHEQAHAVM